MESLTVTLCNDDIPTLDGDAVYRRHTKAGPATRQVLQFTWQLCGRSSVIGNQHVALKLLFENSLKLLHSTAPYNLDALPLNYRASLLKRTELSSFKIRPLRRN